jgi:hypothetical protein
MQEAITSGLTFLYAEYWSSLSTWSGEVPPRGPVTGIYDSVHIPAGHNVIMDVSPPHVNLILIEGTLIVADQPSATINANYIFVRGGRF